jgi:hypothetical protein
MPRPSHPPCFDHPKSENTKIKIYYTITSLVFLHGCGTWYLTFREEHTLKAFEEKVLGIFSDGIGGWRKIHFEELQNFNFSSYIKLSNQGKR